MKKYDVSLKKELLQLIHDKPMNYGLCCNSKNYFLLKNKILSEVPLLNDDNFSFKTRIFWILNDIDDFPKCSICGKLIYRNVVTLETGYNKYKKWQLQDIFNLTCYNKNYIKTNSAISREQTCLKKYGVKNPWESSIIKKKIIETNIAKYGISNGGNSVDGRNKAKKTWIANYGVDHPLKSEEIKNKIQNTCLKKYGTNYYVSSNQYKINKKASNLKKFLDFFNTHVDPEIEFVNLEEELQSLSCAYDFWNTKFTMHCKKCNSMFKAYPNGNNYYKHGTYSACLNCHPSFSSSIYEKQIADFIKLLNCLIILNSRKIIVPKELDIYIPEKNLAIEFDGLYWHSNKMLSNKFGTEENMYHLIKTNLCEEKGIQLIHIFENEWIYKQDIVKSRLKNLLGIYDKTVFARKCDVREVESNESKKFLNENHIQGAVNSKVNLGLYFGNELISLMTFSKPRFDKKHEWELVRFCNKLGYHIPGGASKLLKHFERTYSPKNIVSYADRRWSKGKLYEALGFKLDHISKPDYWYWKHSNDPILESRIKYQKHKLKDLLENFDESKTEVENMYENGYHRIFDCGNLVFEKIYLSTIY